MRDGGDFCAAHHVFCFFLADAAALHVKEFVLAEPADCCAVRAGNIFLIAQNHRNRLVDGGGGEKQCFFLLVAGCARTAALKVNRAAIDFYAVVRDNAFDRHFCVRGAAFVPDCVIHVQKL